MARQQQTISTLFSLKPGDKFKMIMGYFVYTVTENDGKSVSYKAEYQRNPTQSTINKPVYKIIL